MKEQALRFNSIVETIYSLTLEDRLEIKNLLDHNIEESRRTEIATNYKNAQEELKSGKMKFSSEIDKLKKML
ncbi:MAG: hypothetical protein WCX31_12695 [Salinivirgaceae bacterium]|jgi:hypothetical protein